MRDSERLPHKPAPQTGAEMSPIDKVLCLQNADIFHHTTTEMLAYVGSIAHEQRFPAGAIIFSEDDISDAMYVVAAGRVRLEKKRQEVVVVAEGQSFGTWALLDASPRIMTAIVVEDALLLQIDRTEFHDFLADHEEVTPAIFKAVIERVKKLAPE